MRSFALVAACGLMWPLSLPGQTAQERAASVRFLRELQTPDGGFLPAPAGKRPAGEEPSSLRATTAAVRALRYLGGQPVDLEGCRRFVHDCFDARAGGFRDHPRSSKPPDVVTTAVGIMGVAALRLPADEYQKAISFLDTEAKTFEEVRMAAAGLEALQARAPHITRWIQEVQKRANADGSFGKGDGAARETASAAVTIVRLGGVITDRDKVLSILRAGQRSDGGFGRQGENGSDLESTYRVLRAFVMLKAWPPQPGKCRQLVARCRNEDGGFGTAPGQPSTVAGTYFAASILHWLADR